MAAAETYAPWFKPLFVAIWAMTMAYLWTLIFVVVRLRRREGALSDGGIGDWVKVVFDPAWVRASGGSSAAGIAPSMTRS